MRMTRALALALFAGSSDALVQFQAPVQQLSDWKYYPAGAKIGIVSGGFPEQYEKFNYGAKDASLMLKYAKRHGYAFFVDKNLGRFGNRRKTWNKVPLMQQLLKEVPTLVWMDPDIMITDLSKPMDQLMATVRCDGSDQNKFKAVNPKKANNDTFLWLSADVSPIKNLVNANTGVIVMKQSQDAFDFLEKVWHVGDDPKHFEHHEDSMRYTHKKPDSDGYGWPFEMGAFWDVLVQDKAKYMRKTCIAPVNDLQSVRSYRWGPGKFAMNLNGIPDPMKRQAGEEQLKKVGGHAEIK